MKRSLLPFFSIIFLSILPTVGLAEIGRSEVMVQQSVNQRQVINQFIQQLKKTDYESITNAVQLLLLTGESAVPDLILLLNDPRESVRWSAIKVLGSMGEASETAIPDLILRLKDPAIDVRSSAASVLGEMGKSNRSAVPYLIPLLKDSDKNTRLSAATALGKMGESAKSAIPDLIILLKDSPSVIARAAWALGNIGESAIPVLIPLLKDSDKNTRWGAVLALSKGLARK